MSPQLPVPVRPPNPRVERAWYVLCTSRELGRRPLARQLYGVPLVLFRGAGGAAAALVDRCPHRNVPLSEGVVEGELLRCPYHGWRFDAAGRCKAIPGLAGEPDRAAHAALAHDVREQQGYVWVWGRAGEPGEGEPFRFRHADDPQYTVVRRKVSADASVHLVAENALDVPHTAFLHGGLFRSDADRKPIRCVVTREADRVACEYVGEARPSGLVGRLLSPSGGEVVHFDRFYLPSIVEVEYRIGAENHILVDAALTPVDDDRTDLYAVVALKSRIPGWLVRPLVTPVALRIFAQDQAILRKQVGTIQRFGGARFVSTEIDLVGPHILKLLLRAASGAPSPEQPSVREGTLLV
ncbi:MAG: aromatic ring-hydroxylating dioxygenase subunit alpha [Myxococcota bacterium]